MTENDGRDVIAKGEIFTLKRQTAKIVWTEIKFIDTQAEPREAFSRTCIGLGSNVQCLITFDYWVDQAQKLTPIWDEVMRSLTLGLYIRDSTNIELVLLFQIKPKKSIFIVSKKKSHSQLR